MSLMNNNDRQAELDAVRQKIADAVKEQLGIEIDKKKLQLENPIRELGTATVLLKLHTKVTASLKVAVKEA